MIDGETWRVYAVTNEELGVRVLVGDSMWIRDRLVNDVIRGLLLPALLDRLASALDERRGDIRILLKRIIPHALFDAPDRLARWDLAPPGWWPARRWLATRAEAAE